MSLVSSAEAYLEMPQTLPQLGNAATSCPTQPFPKDLPPLQLYIIGIAKSQVVSLSVALKPWSKKPMAMNDSVKR